jgi:hypothetical protein
MLIQNLFQKLGHPVFGVYERTACKNEDGNFTFHIHVIVACPIDKLNRQRITKCWQNVKKSLRQDSTFKTLVQAPWLNDPYRKFWYHLKMKRAGKWVKPFGEGGRFDFFVNSDNTLWSDKKMPQDSIAPQIIERLQSEYFKQSMIQRKFISYIEFYQLYRKGPF